MTENTVDNKRSFQIVDTFDGMVKINYSRLIKEFGIEPFIKVLDSIPDDQRMNFMTRDIMFGHTDMQKIINVMNKRNSFACMTGIKPTGPYHIGSSSTC
jgi:hypothetical protein